MPRMSDAKNRGLIERDEGTESNELDRTIGKWVYGRRERAGAALSNWPNMLSHMEVLFSASPICAPPEWHNGNVNTMCRNVFSFSFPSAPERDSSSEFFHDSANKVDLEMMKRFVRF